MANKPRKNTFLIALAFVSLVVLSYLMFIFLAPGTGLSTVDEAIPVDVQTSLIETAAFKKLRPFANLPIIPTNVGRINPFIPFFIPNLDENGDEILLDENGNPIVTGQVNG